MDPSPDPSNPITQFFPIEGALPQEPPAPEASNREVDDRTRKILTDVVEESQSYGSHSDNPPSMGNNYEAFRTAEDLPDMARRFYSAAGK